MAPFFKSNLSEHRVLLQMTLLLVILSGASAFHWHLDDQHFVRWALECGYQGAIIEAKDNQETGERCASFCVGNNNCNHFNFDNEAKACQLLNSDDYSNMIEKYKGPGYACGYRLVTYSEECSSP